MTDKPPRLLDIAMQARGTIAAADMAGLMINDSNVIDLLADNIPDVPLNTLRDALVVAGLSPRFIVATRHRWSN